MFVSLDEVMLFKKSLPYNLAMRYKNIKLNPEFPDYDLFEISGAQYFTLVSGVLRNELVNQNITGFEFLEYDRIQK